VQIEYLADHPEFIPVLAGWHHQEWAYLRPGDTLEARTERLRAECGRGEIPTVFVALEDGNLLGSAMLIEHDMDTRMELAPWLAGVFVAPDYRHRGIGSALVRRVVQCAKSLGIKRLYLYTPSAERLYSQLGWSFLERTSYQGTEVAIMFYDLTGAGWGAEVGGQKSEVRSQMSEVRGRFPKPRRRLTLLLVHPFCSLVFGLPQSGVIP
jgi:GNAT superfamily N-acetyltransferase